MDAEKSSTLDRYKPVQIMQTEEANTSRHYQKKMQLQDEINHPMIHLPVQDNSVDLITQVMKQMRFIDDDGKGSEPEMKHFSHDHPLKLITLHTSIACESLQCEACVSNISSAPYYSCQECNFLIHKGCAELPREIQHSFHPDHPLVLIDKATAEFADLFECNACRFSSNGFAYNCASCEFYLDIFCSSLSNVLSHKAHLHPLILRQEEPESVLCDACQKHSSGFLFGCTKCGFNLDIPCAAYPGIVRHRHDKHALKLSYPFTERHSADTGCEICGDMLNIKGSWFYNCGDCSHAFHPECICNQDVYRFIKFGRRIDLKGHPHPLKMVLDKGEKPSCSNCGNPYEGISFKCTAGKCQYQVNGLDFSFNLDGFCAHVYNVIDYDSQNE